MATEHEKGDSNDGIAGAEAEDRAQGRGANNFLTEQQRRAARRMWHRRMAWYHGPDWRTERSGSRLTACIRSLPTEAIRQLRIDLTGGYEPTLGGPIDRWSLGQLVRNTATVMFGRALQQLPDEGSDPIYTCTLIRGTLQIARHGAPFANLELEPGAQWDAAEATNNPTGALRDAPAGALRILCLCSMGLGTGVELRLKTERILATWQADGWLEVRGVLTASDAISYTDILLATRDEADAARRLAEGRDLRIVVVDNWLDSSQIRRSLASAMDRSATARR